MKPLLLALLLLASPAMAAEWRELSFPAPSPQAVSYLAQRGNATTAWAPANLYRSTADLTAPVVPGAPGTPELLSVSVTADANAPLGWKNGGTVIRVRAVRADGSVSAWMPYTVTASPVPDSMFCDGGRPGCKRPTGGRITFQRAAGDTLLGSPSLGGPLIVQAGVPPPPPPALPYVVHFEYTVPAMDDSGTCKAPILVAPKEPDILVTRTLMRYESYSFANKVYVLRDEPLQRRGDHFAVDVPVATNNYYYELKIAMVRRKADGTLIPQRCPADRRLYRAVPR